MRDAKATPDRSSGGWRRRLLLLALSALLLTPVAEAQVRGPQQVGIRIGETAAFADRPDFNNQELYIRLQPWNWSGEFWYPDYGHLEAALARFDSEDDSASAVMLGPVLGWNLPVERLTLEIGIRPTWLSSSRIGSLDMGGRFHFTSHLGLGWRFSRQLSVALRIQHTSNGGIDQDNPGLDIQMLELGYRF